MTEPSSRHGPSSLGGGTRRMPAVNDVGEPCAGEPHARFDGRELETERRTWPRALGWHSRPGNRRKKGPRPYRQEKPPRQLPTLHGIAQSGCVDQLKGAPEQRGSRLSRTECSRIAEHLSDDVRCGPSYVLHTTRCNSESDSPGCIMWSRIAGHELVLRRGATNDWGDQCRWPGYGPGMLMKRRICGDQHRRDSIVQWPGAALGAHGQRALHRPAGNPWVEMRCEEFRGRHTPARLSSRVTPDGSR